MKKLPECLGSTIFAVLLALYCGVGMAAGEKKTVDQKAPTPQVYSIPDEISDLKVRNSRLEKKVARLETRIRSASGNSPLSYEGAWYLRAGLGYLMPRSSSFTTLTENGLGLHGGLGHYVNKYNAVELSLDWDVYLATTLRYRFEVPLSNESFALGPVIGVRQKIAPSSPFQRFIEQADSVNDTFMLLGIRAAVPLQSSVLTTELSYLTNDQSLFNATVSLHYFL